MLARAWTGTDRNHTLARVAAKATLKFCVAKRECFWLATLVVWEIFDSLSLAASDE